MKGNNVAILILFVLVIIILLKLTLFKGPTEKFMNYLKRTFKQAETNQGLNQNGYITFDKFYKSTPKHVYYPNNIKDIQNAVKQHLHDKIRVSGGHHTFNDISLSDDVMIKTFNLKDIISVDHETKQVTVEAGITLDELCMFLETENLALPVLPAIPLQTIGGCVSTATHGSHIASGTLSDVVMAMTLVTGRGNVLKVDIDDPDFPAFATSLGALGVIYSITLQCIDLFAIEHTREESTWKNVKQKIPELLHENQYLQFYIKPFTKDHTTIIYKRKRLDLPPAELESLKGLGYDKPVKRTQNTSGIYYRILTRNEEADHYTETEIGIPYERAIEAIGDVLQLYKRFYDDGYRSNKPLLVRFTGPDYNSWMSMTSGRSTVFLDVFKEAPFDNPEQHLKFFKEFESLLIYKYNGRPHWGKRHFLDEHTTQVVYGLSVDYFNRVRKKNDPEGIFSNDYIKRILG